MFCQALFCLTFETFCGAGTGNRTRVSSLEGWCSTIELHPHNGRGDRDRTCDLMVPNHARSHLRHTPKALFHRRSLATTIVILQYSYYYVNTFFKVFLEKFIESSETLIKSMFSFLKKC
jgi:hypothetical protein